MKKAVVAAGVLLILVVPALWFVGRPAYRHHKEARAVEQAKKFLARQDFRNASLSARQALLVNARNLAACEIMAQMAQRIGAPQWLDWRQRIAEVAPTTENKLELAAAALMIQDPPCPLAARTLAELSTAAENLPRFHVLSAELALKRNQLAEAEAHFLAASRLEPANQAHELNVAVLRLHSTNLLLAAQGRATLERLSGNTNFAVPALRSLVSDSLSQTNPGAAEAFSARLVADPRAGLEDRLRHLSILRQLDRVGPFLSAMQGQAGTNSAVIQALSNWMIENGLAREAFSWVTNYPAKLRQEKPLRLAQADCYMAMKDWEGLEGFLGEGKWGEIECIRLALLSRAAAARKNEAAAEAQWRLAVYQAGDKLERLNALLNLSSLWGREKAREDLLWEITCRFPKERWACDELGRLYYAAGNTRSLNKLYGALSSSDSSDLMARNNFATTSLLLGQNLLRAHEWARENYSRSPEEPIVASTYAFSLHVQGRSKEGVAILEKLRPEALRDPAVALYYALLLSADGQTVKAAKYISAIDRTRLLPEENALLAQVKERGVGD